jgi:hypothetical protein
MTEEKRKPARGSKKYSKGSVHEIAGGRIRILERYLNEDDEVMLQYQYIDTGDIKDNKEVNVSSSIHHHFRNTKNGTVATTPNPNIPNYLDGEYDEILDQVTTFNHTACGEQEVWHLPQADWYRFMAKHERLGVDIFKRVGELKELSLDDLQTKTRFYNELEKQSIAIKEILYKDKEQDHRMVLINSLQETVGKQQTLIEKLYNDIAVLNERLYSRHS